MASHSAESAQHAGLMKLLHDMLSFLVEAATLTGSFLIANSGGFLET